MRSEWYYIQRSIEKKKDDEFTSDEDVPTVCVNDKQESDDTDEEGQTTPRHPSG